MKIDFKCTQLPDSPGFDPKSEGYASLREPDPVKARKYLYLIGFAFALLLVGLFLWWVPYSLNIDLLALALWIIVNSILLVPVHELLHAVCFPDTRKITFGMLRQIGAIYTYYDGTLKKARMLLSLLLPTLVLSVLPFILLLTGIWHLSLFTLMACNALSCGGDLMGTYLILARTPPNSTLRNKGYRTYYKA